MTGDPASVKLGLAYDIGGRGDQSFNDLAAASLDKAKAAGVTITGELTAAQGEPDSAKTDRLNQLIDDGATDIIAVGFAYAGAVKEVAAANPDVNFAIVDDNSLAAVPNVASLTFAEEQGSYLVGVAAGKKTKTNKVGFIGGVNTPLIQKFQAGYEAGVKATNPSATVTVEVHHRAAGLRRLQLAAARARPSPPACTTTASTSSTPRPAAPVPASSRRPRPPATWASAWTPTSTTRPTLADVKDVIMTSMLKKVDVATYDFITSAVNGDVLTGEHKYDLSQRRRRLRDLRRQDRRHRAGPGEGQGGHHRRDHHRALDHRLIQAVS